jgi:hypothetical protein
MDVYDYVFVACSVGLLGVGLGLIQYARLSRYRKRRVIEINHAVQYDATVGRDSHWRYVMLDAPSLDAMLWKFWRSFDSFYPDRSFLDPKAVDPNVVGDVAGPPPPRKPPVKASRGPVNSRLSLRVSEKGGVSLCGLGRLPVTLYKEQWRQVLEMADEIQAFLREHDSELKTK